MNNPIKLIDENSVKSSTVQEIIQDTQLENGIIFILLKVYNFL